MLKKLLLALALIVSNIGLTIAWEQPNNPDRFPSLGLTYTGLAEDGEYTTLGVSQAIDVRSGALVLDTRIPFTNSFTLSLGIGATGTNVSGESNFFFNSDELDTSGALFTIGGRFYFNR